MTLSRRCHDPERMDDPDVDVATMRRTLRELDRINRLLGGWSGSRALLEPELAPSLHVLDVGAGGGGTARDLVSWGRARGSDIRVTMIDLHPAVCRVAAETAGPSTALVRADAFRLPFADRSFDWVHASLFLHHFRDGAIRRLLKEMARVSRNGILVNDLERHPVAFHSIRLLTRLCSRSALVRHDAPLSVRRGFRGEEVARWTAELPHARLTWTRRWPFRLLVRIAPEGP